MKQPDVSFLVWGLARSLIWFSAAVYFLTVRRRVLLPAGFLCLGLNTIPFVFLNAHYPVSQPLLDAATLIATPAAALVVAGAAVLVLNIPVRWRGQWTGFRL